MRTHTKSARLVATPALTPGTITVTGTAASAVSVRALAVMSPSTAPIDSPSLARHLHVRHLHVRHVRSAPTTASPGLGAGGGGPVRYR